ncbi:tetratricopeptide repeat protein [Methylotetracoccus oryzae]|uniref:tetratricopeptide repeat protein n=1 Tax=Methylotetracoccus oryzae TaxID=1919059 RepID=UPI00111899F5|nr:tetratricopeptide repeat protein [Methylotetracoccus oryzae]
MSEPIHYQLDEAAFDLTLLPENARTVGSSAFRAQVQAFFEQQYRGFAGETTVLFENGKISVTWIPRTADEDPRAAVLALLQSGRYDEAKPLLETALQANPRDHDALYNLGMVYSDEGRLAEAIELLRRATDAQPDYVNAWVALGVAALRSGDTEAGQTALERAIELDPANPHALRSLGTLGLMNGQTDRGIELLRRAVALSPDDPVSRLTLAKGLIDQDIERNTLEADGLLREVLRLSPQGEVAEKAKEALGKLAAIRFRGGAGEGVRPDALHYCLDAFERFDGMGRDTLMPIVMEMANLGQGGLPVNDPTKKFRLQLLHGEFSALQIVCMMHVGLKQIDPNLDSGFDIDKEYAAAQALHSGSGRQG